ncbi:hypothetical protein V7S43_014328 [Phytophthora oleae]|uniref:Ankyrin repeat-containing domain n=1 Tax=Phytophthora oleae TaxID=2107226 RepID=A0ABD3F1C8_9STRA
MPSTVAGCSTRLANGDLESLQWLMESYLPGEFLTKVVSAAATNGHLSILQWLFENHHDRGYWGFDSWLYGRSRMALRAECMVGVMDAAVSAGYLSVVKWLHEEHNVSMRSAISNAMDNQQWEISQWILEHRELVASTGERRTLSLPKVHLFLLDRKAGLLHAPEGSMEWSLGGCTANSARG